MCCTQYGVEKCKPNLLFSFLFSLTNIHKLQFNSKQFFRSDFFSSFNFLR